MHIVDKPIIERTKGEIEKRLSQMGDYVKMSYLQRALSSHLDFDTKKFVFSKLAEIYHSRNMFLEAAKMMKGGAEINTTFKDKIRDYMKVVELYIKGGDYVESDRIFVQALALANDREKQELKKKRKEYYMMQAEAYFSRGKRSQAKTVYERILALDLTPEEKKLAQGKLLDLYNKLGNVREYYNLKRSI